MTVAITRKEPGAAELRREAKRCRDAKAARRMLALALVLLRLMPQGITGRFFRKST